MSRALSRIRNLISEIEEIQRQGQQGGKAVVERSANLMPEPPVLLSVATKVVPPVMQAKPEIKPEIEFETKTETNAETKAKTSPDPFDDLANLVDLDTKRPEPAGAQNAGKVFVQLSGHVALSLQIADSDEKVELQQVGNMIEIRFADGKAFHLPFKAVS